MRRFLKENNMFDWFMNLDIIVQLFLSAAIGGGAAVLLILFGDIVTPDDMI
jgi:hypothetical protein